MLISYCEALQDPMAQDEADAVAALLAAASGEVTEEGAALGGPGESLSLLQHLPSAFQ